MSETGETPQDEGTTADASGQPSRTYVRDARTSASQGRFAAAFAVKGNISQAAEVAEVHRQRHYDWMKSDPDYPAMFLDAGRQYVESLEAEATRRAREGWDEPVYQQGRQVGTVRKHSDQLLMFLMRGHDSKYKDVAPAKDVSPDPIGLDERQRQIMMDELDRLAASEDAGGAG